MIPFDRFRVSSRLARTVRSDVFSVTVDAVFKAVIAGCAAPQPGRDDTWINKRIRDLYVGLHELGHAHSVEVWQNDELVGGLYGVSLGQAFFGESMFHRSRDASKVALVHLVARLIAGGFSLLDTQYVTEHLRSFGAVEIPRRRYRGLLDRAIAAPADFGKLPLDPPLGGARALQIIVEHAGRPWPGWSAAKSGSSVSRFSDCAPLHPSYVASSVIPGRAALLGASPEIHSPDGGYGFRACAKRRIPE